MSYKDYYEIHKNDEYIDGYSVLNDWIADKDLHVATIDSIKELGQERCANHIQKIRDCITEETKSLHEVLNITNFLIVSVNENKADFTIFKPISFLLTKELWLYYKEPFENYLDRLGEQFDIKFE
jgi:hypothetical protein